MSDAGSSSEAVREVEISLAGIDPVDLLGPRDSWLRLLQERTGARLTVRGERMLLRGTPAEVAAARAVVERLLDLLRRGRVVDAVSVEYVLGGVAAGEVESGDAGDEPILYTVTDRRPVRARTAGQQAYVEAVRRHDVVFAIGPAGTGKTYLAVAMAVDALRRGLVERIILVRPAVEAGEQLGFLPGDLQEKIDPYLRPLYDALAETIGPARIQRYMQSGVIEAAPLAYMRGRTLSRAFVILDEAQNTTLGQMKMFLPRLGRQSKAVITGDITQIDLAAARRSGLILVRDILADTDGIAFVELSRRDVVRHPLVQRIVEAFRDAEQSPPGEGDA